MHVSSYTVQLRALTEASSEQASVDMEDFGLGLNSTTSVLWSFHGLHALVVFVRFGLVSVKYQPLAAARARSGCSACALKSTHRANGMTGSLSLDLGYFQT